MYNDMRIVDGLSFISKQFVSDHPDLLVKEAPVYIMHELYKFVPTPNL